MKPAIIVDLDGTLALRHMRHPLNVAEAKSDHLCVPVAAILTLFQRNGNPVILLTHRSFQQGHDVVVTWLQDKLNWNPGDYILFMRDDDDHRADHIVKRSIYEEKVRPSYQVLFSIDNSPRCCEMWRGLGLYCLQV